MSARFFLCSVCMGCYSEEEKCLGAQSSKVRASQSNLNLVSEVTDRQGTKEGEIEEVERDDPTNDDILDHLPLDPFDQGFAALALNCSHEIEELYIPSSEFSSTMEELDWVYRNSATLEFSKLSLNESLGEPHEALTFVLPYLELKDLLSVERVCRSLRDEVRSNTLLWRSISIYSPLSRKIDDEALLSLSSKARGTLESLTLIGCCKIRNGALKRVLDSNPKLQKLSVPGCLHISVDDVLNNLRDLKSAGKFGIKILRLGDLRGGTLPIFEELKCLLPVEENEKKHNPRFYNWMNPYILSDDRAIDVEPCPKCSEVTQVYDCPLKICQEKCDASQSCRGCIACIPRCSECGRCEEDSTSEFYEGMHFNFICRFCFKEFYQPVAKIVSSTCAVIIRG